ncbi:MAG: RpiB/LacA/LacB family sugar-phosphate isomerase [Propionibacteriaceae bacterium]|jgi:ribose 5-phosphate isomerase B|uniref:Ribose 5-phosphate isomerase B n=1 Tax=Brooklawnia propionicigenes TaxID=3041175 RepID=A0AAN0KDK1_9ACTN|nr:RpiB/LacA/LacB family sugar-phosphate isomerase [Brooklawnia sp. SH051]MCB0883259.1 RpiB/LacA/LacB family sugar-phosphate isomerase [Propionibacteriaceae bacterium]MEA5120722.1 RpiB/LacA/LacB family sugar-phosphate isomerase [Propionibacterium sp.]NLI85614.1 RpiB/LacA/LacB family sugar-phosphate isomerase [Propionibacterium sp.]BEH03440.1 ribose 5-phosphate isomerase B [Brooklawnia sp. SH051]
MKLAFGCDPNAAELKKALIAKAESLGHEVTDFGSDDPIYANVAADVAHAVAEGKYDRGVVVCGTGIGVSLAANKVKGAYCALIADPYSAQRATLSNNANMIAMGAQTTGVETAKVLLELYLANTFDPNSRSGVKVARVVEIEAEQL